MRTKLLPFIIGCAIVFASCVKQGVNPNTILGPSNKTIKIIDQGALVGKWSVSKVEAYALDLAGNQSNTVTYEKPLSDSNYVAFSKDNLCLWSADHYYTYGQKGNGVIRQDNFRKLSFHYKLSGLSIDLQAPQAPNGPHAVPEYENATILSPTAIVIHSTYSIDDGKWMVSDTYFTRQ
jgi:hypothetical protein